MRVVFTLGLSLLTSFYTYTFSQKIISVKDTINGNAVSVQMDSKINDLLLDAEKNCKRIVKVDTNNSNNNVPTTVKTTNNNPNRDTTLPKQTNNRKSNADICQRTPRLSGFKIQVLVTNNLDDASKIRTEVRQIFPDLRTELDSSLRPNYKVLAGSYFSKASGQSDLKKVRKIYQNATLVPYRIFCSEAK